MLGTFIKICQENPSLVDIRQNIRHLAQRPKYFYDITEFFVDCLWN